jgi:hypothetical protein
MAERPARTFFRWVAAGTPARHESWDFSRFHAALLVYMSGTQFQIATD